MKQMGTSEHDEKLTGKSCHCRELRTKEEEEMRRTGIKDWCAMYYAVNI